MSTHKYEVTTNTISVLFVGGAHGNEQSGHLALQNHSFKQRKRYNGVRIVRISNVNPYGIKHNIRRNSLNQDLNRFYGVPHSDKQVLPDKDRHVVELIETFAKRAHVVVDFHETPSKPRCVVHKSIGHTIISDNSQELASKVTQKVNVKLPAKKKVVFMDKKKEIKHSLRHFCHLHKIPYILVEMSKSIPKPERVLVCHLIIDEILVEAKQYL